MPKFALTYPYFIIMACLVILVVGVTNIAGMPVDLFPQIQIPVVVVATFYSGMPPAQIEADITDTFERFFTLGSIRRSRPKPRPSRRPRRRGGIPTSTARIRPTR